ncbi:hypothetical protein BHM03_00051819, partial [Ensete ventricosum]
VRGIAKSKDSVLMQCLYTDDGVFFGMLLVLEGCSGGTVLAKSRNLASKIRAARELDCFSVHIRLREPGKSEEKAEWLKGARKRRRVQWGSVPKTKASVRKEVDSEEYHSAVEADLPIAKEGIQMQGNG